MKLKPTDKPVVKITCVNGVTYLFRGDEPKEKYKGLPEITQVKLIEKGVIIYD